MRILISFIAGFLLILPMSWLFDVMKWPLFNGWALAHGSFMVAWPMLWLIAYLLFGLCKPKKQ